MKKTLAIAVILIAGLLAFVSSCTKDKFTEKDAYNAQKELASLQDSLSRSQILLRDSLKNVGGVINYSVGAILAGDANWISNLGASSKGSQILDQVVVTISQYGIRKVDTTDVSGIASFKDLRIGTVNVNVRKAGYTEVDFVALLPALSEPVDVDAYGIVRNVGTMIPLFSLTDNLSKISGIATVETDLINNAPEIAANVDIMATIDVDNNLFQSTYLQQKVPDVTISSLNFDYYGIIKQIAFHSVFSKATTAADGSFTLNVPSTPDGLPIRISVSEFAANQQLLQSTINNIPVWGVQTVRTLFGSSDALMYSQIPKLGTASDNVQSAYVTISAPSGTPAAQPSVKAAATAVLSNSGIESVNITNPGEGYTQPPKVEIANGSAFNSVKAEGTAVVSNGKVTGVTITDAGSGYKPDDAPTVSFIDGIEQRAVYEAEFSFSLVDIDFTPSFGHDGYTQTPPDVTISGSGTGATAHAEMTADIRTITVTATGSQYTQAPQVTIADNFSAWDGATPVMTTNNPLFSINYNGTNSTLWPVAPVPTATIAGDGVGATAQVVLGPEGKIIYAAGIVHGSGYTSAPVVTITGGGGFGATGHAVLNGNTVDTVIIDDQGQGYDGIPTIIFTGGAGTGATATAVVGHPVESISLTTAGVGYNYITAININNGGANVNYYDDCTVKYNMGLRDITFDDNGWFYKEEPAITITPKDGNGSGATAVAEIEWHINDIVVDNPGSGYKLNDESNIHIRIDTSPTNVQATASPVLGNGVLSAAGAVTLGEGYAAAPNVYMVDNSEGNPPIRQAKMSAIVIDGHVTEISITDPGEGYDYSSAINGNYYISVSTFNSEATASAHANPKSGQIAYIQVDNPGSGYAVAPTIEIVNNDSIADSNNFGTGAAATANVVDGRVSSITISNPGSGYYIAPTITITVPSTLLTAVGQCKVSADGRITDVTFPEYFPYTKGYGYNSIPTVTFNPSVSGKGTGAAGIAILKDGQVDNIVVTNQGSGYLGRNNPDVMKPFTVIPDNAQIVTFSGMTYIRDVYFGTGKRTDEGLVD
jgi:hypothetical protein